MLRENVFNLRSASFDIDYDSSTERFTFTTFGHGHGVGMSQNGVMGMINAGYDYEQILRHYYPGVSIERRVG
jgi:stage II sporulation protein D